MKQPNCLAYLAGAAIAAPAGAQNLFPIAETISPSYTWSFAAPANVDQDGIVDLLMYSEREGAIKLFRGEGGGAFSEPERADVFVPDTVAMEIRDLDADGFEDVLLTSSVIGTWEFTYARRSGEANFDLTTALSIPQTPEVPFLALFGQAQEPALVVARLGVGIEIHPWNGVGFDQIPTVIPARDPERARLGDVDGDGFDDVVYFDLEDQTWRFSSYLGPGQFAPARPFLPVAAQLAPDVTFGDLDGDGDTDLVALDESNVRQFKIFERLASGGFGPAMTRSTLLDLATTDLEILDIDGDSRADIKVLARGQFPPGPAWLRNLGGFVLGPIQPLGGEPVPDLTGDGLPDALSQRVRPAVVLTGQGSAPGDWFETALPIGEVEPFFSRSWTQDADGDSDLDVILEVRPGDQLWCENLGGLNFKSARPLVPAIDRPVAIFRADFVGDSEIDLLVRATGGALGIRRGLGGGNFAPTVIISSLLSGIPVVVDMDGDGDLDILQSNSFAPNVTDHWLIENSGIGNQFPRRVLIRWQEGVIEAVPADVDGDGLQDLVTRSSASPFASDTFRPNLGSAVFGQPEPLPGGPSSTFRATSGADYDQDGDEDLLGFIGNRPAIRASFASITYAPFELLFFAGTVSLRDLDDNGFVDFLNQGTSEYRLQGAFGGIGETQRIGPNVPSIPSSYAQTLLLADFDGDGDDDAIMSARALFVVENQSVPQAGVPSAQCPSGNNNSTGLPGELRAYGSTAVASTDLVLQAVQLPPSQFGFFVGSQDVGAPMPVFGSSGSICLAGSIGRYDGTGQILTSGPDGSFALDLDPGALMTSTGAVPALANETWFFQAWHRDVDAAGAATSQFTGALALTFLP